MLPGYIVIPLYPGYADSERFRLNAYLLGPGHTVITFYTDDFYSLKTTLYQFILPALLI